MVALKARNAVEHHRQAAKVMTTRSAGGLHSAYKALVPAGACRRTEKDIPLASHALPPLKRLIFYFLALVLLIVQG